MGEHAFVPGVCPHCGVPWNALMRDVVEQVEKERAVISDYRAQLAEATRKLAFVEGTLEYYAERPGGLTARHALAAIRAESTRPAPLSPEAQAARKPLPPEDLVNALQDRVHIERGELIASQPIRAGEMKPRRHREPNAAERALGEGAHLCNDGRAGEANPPNKYAGAKPIEGEPVCVLCNTPAGLHDEEVCYFGFTPASAGEAVCTCVEYMLGRGCGDKTGIDPACPRHGKAREVR